MDASRIRDVIIRAGIDEAGLGPVFGPLTVACVAFRVPSASTDLWKALGEVVTREPDRQRLLVCDSKRLFSQSRGLAPLERSLLPFLGVEPGTTLAALLESLGVLDPAELSRYPWYAHPSPQEVHLPIAADADSIATSTRSLRAAMRDAGVELAGARARVTEGYAYDRGSREHDGRFGLLSRLVSDLLSDTATAHPRADVRVLAGKQGMRSRYEDGLRRAFPHSFIWIRDEAQDRSDYEVAREGEPIRISFLQDGEDRSFEIALASLVCKYLREALMSFFRAWWTAQAPEVSDSAGYGADGKRFLQEIEPRRAALGIPREAMERLR